MSAEWLTAAILIAILTPAFGHFETVRPLWTRILRWLIYLAVTGALGVTVGRPYTFIWLLGLPAAGAVFHTVVVPAQRHQPHNRRTTRALRATTRPTQPRDRRTEGLR